MVEGRGSPRSSDFARNCMSLDCFCYRFVDGFVDKADNVVGDAFVAKDYFGVDFGVDFGGDFGVDFGDFLGHLLVQF